MAQTVHLQGVPVDLYFRATQHTDELLREFTLISMGERADITERDIPTRLLKLMGDLRKRHSDMTGGIRSRFEKARQEGHVGIDLELPGDDTTAEITEELTRLLDAADEYCDGGNLLTLAPDPDVVAWRHWWRDQVVSQIREGAQPVPFPSP